MKRRFKNSNLSLHDQTWFLKQQKKISLKPLLLYILCDYYNWQLEFLCAYDVRFQSVYNGRNFKKKKFFFVLALKFTLLFLEYGNPCGFFIHFVLLYCFPNEVPGFCRYTQKKFGKICICFTRSYNMKNF